MACSSNLRKHSSLLARIKLEDGAILIQEGCLTRILNCSRFYLLSLPLLTGEGLLAGPSRHEILLSFASHIGLVHYGHVDITRSLIDGAKIEAGL